VVDVQRLFTDLVGAPIERLSPRCFRGSLVSSRPAGMPE
jgi:hypothetical protein